MSETFCGTCRGDGTTSGTFLDDDGTGGFATRMCADCDGTGEGTATRCQTCTGTGYCPACGGDGLECGGSRAERQVAAVREKLAGLIDTAPLLDPDEPWTLAQVVAVLRDVRAALETE